MQAPSFLFSGLDQETLALSEELNALGGGDARVSNMEVHVFINSDLNTNAVTNVRSSGGRIAPSSSASEQQVIWAYSDIVAIRNTLLPFSAPAFENMRNYSVTNSTIGKNLSSSNRNILKLAESAANWALDGFNACVLGMGMRSSGKTNLLFNDLGDLERAIDCSTCLTSAILEHIFAAQNNNGSISSSGNGINRGRASTASSSSSSLTVAISAWALYDKQAVDLISPKAQSGKPLEFVAVEAPNIFSAINIINSARARAPGVLLATSHARIAVGENKKAHFFLRIILHQEHEQGRISYITIVDPVGLIATDSKEYANLNEEDRILARGKNVGFNSLCTVLSEMRDISRIAQNSGPKAQQKPKIQSLLANKNDETGKKLLKMTSARNSRLTTVLAPIIQGNTKTFIVVCLTDGETRYNETKNIMGLLEGVIDIQTACHRVKGIPLSSLNMWHHQALGAAASPDSGGVDGEGKTRKWSLQQDQQQQQQPTSSHSSNLRPSMSTFSPDRLSSSSSSRGAGGGGAVMTKEAMERATLLPRTPPSPLSTAAAVSRNIVPAHFTSSHSPSSRRMVNFNSIQEPAAADDSAGDSTSSTSTIARKDSPDSLEFKGIGLETVARSSEFNNSERDAASSSSHRQHHMLLSTDGKKREKGEERDDNDNQEHDHEQDNDNDRDNYNNQGHGHDNGYMQRSPARSPPRATNSSSSSGSSSDHRSSSGSSSITGGAAKWTATPPRFRQTQQEQEEQQLAPPSTGGHSTGTEKSTTSNDTSDTRVAAIMGEFNKLLSELTTNNNASGGAAGSGDFYDISPLKNSSFDDAAPPRYSLSESQKRQLKRQVAERERAAIARTSVEIESAAVEMLRDAEDEGPYGYGDDPAASATFTAAAAAEAASGGGRGRGGESSRSGSGNRGILKHRLSRSPSPSKVHPDSHHHNHNATAAARNNNNNGVSVGRGVSGDEDNDYLLPNQRSIEGQLAQLTAASSRSSRSRGPEQQEQQKEEEEEEAEFEQLYDHYGGNNVHFCDDEDEGDEDVQQQEYGTSSSSSSSSDDEDDDDDESDTSSSSSSSESEHQDDTYVQSHQGGSGGGIDHRNHNPSERYDAWKRKEATKKSNKRGTAVPSEKKLPKKKKKKVVIKKPSSIAAPSDKKLLKKGDFGDSAPHATFGTAPRATTTTTTTTTATTSVSPPGRSRSRKRRSVSPPAAAHRRHTTTGTTTAASTTATTSSTINNNNNNSSNNNRSGHGSSKPRSSTSSGSIVGNTTGSSSSSANLRSSSSSPPPVSRIVTLVFAEAEDKSKKTAAAAARSPSKSRPKSPTSQSPSRPPSRSPPSSRSSPSKGVVAVSEIESAEDVVAREHKAELQRQTESMQALLAGLGSTVRSAVVEATNKSSSSSSAIHNHNDKDGRRENTNSTTASYDSVDNHVDNGINGYQHQHQHHHHHHFEPEHQRRHHPAHNNHSNSHSNSNRWEGPSPKKRPLLASNSVEVEVEARHIPTTTTTTTATTTDNNYYYHNTNNNPRSSPGGRSDRERSTMSYNTLFLNELYGDKEAKDKNENENKQQRRHYDGRDDENEDEDKDAALSYVRNRSQLFDNTADINSSSSSCSTLPPPYKYHYANNEHSYYAVHRDNNSTTSSTATAAAAADAAAANYSCSSGSGRSSSLWRHPVGYSSSRYLVGDPLASQRQGGGEGWVTGADGDGQAGKEEDEEEEEEEDGGNPMGCDDAEGSAEERRKDRADSKAFRDISGGTFNAQRMNMRSVVQLGPDGVPLTTSLLLSDPAIPLFHAESNRRNAAAIHTAAMAQASGGDSDDIAAAAAALADGGPRSDAYLEIERLLRTNDALLSALSEEKARRMRMEDKVAHVDDDIAEIKTQEDIKLDDYRLEIARLKQQLRVVCTNRENVLHNTSAGTEALMDIYNVFEENVERLSKENAALREEKLKLESREHKRIFDEIYTAEEQQTANNNNNNSSSSSSSNSFDASGGSGSSEEDADLNSTPAVTGSGGGGGSGSFTPNKEASHQLNMAAKENNRLRNKLKASGIEREQIKAAYEELRQKERQFTLSSKLAIGASQRLRNMHKEFEKAKVTIENQSLTVNKLKNESEIACKERDNAEQSESRWRAERNRLVSENGLLRQRVRELESERGREDKLNKFVTKHAYGSNNHSSNSNSNSVPTLNSSSASILHAAGVTTHGLAYDDRDDRDIDGSGHLHGHKQQQQQQQQYYHTRSSDSPLKISNANHRQNDPQQQFNYDYQRPHHNTAAHPSSSSSSPRPTAGQLYQQQLLEQLKQQHYGVDSSLMRSSNGSTSVSATIAAAAAAGGGESGGGGGGGSRNSSRHGSPSSSSSSAPGPGPGPYSQRAVHSHSHSQHSSSADQPHYMLNIPLFASDKARIVNSSRPNSPAPPPPPPPLPFDTTQLSATNTATASGPKRKRGINGAPPPPGSPPHNWNNTSSRPRPLTDSYSSSGSRNGRNSNSTRGGGSVTGVAGLSNATYRRREEYLAPGKSIPVARR